MKSILITATLFAAMSSLSACDTTPPPAPFVTSISNIEFSTGELSTPFQQAQATYEVTSLNTLGSTRIRVSSPEQGTVMVDGQRVAANTWVNLPLNTLAANRTLAVSAGDTAAVTQYRIATLPADFPKFKLQVGAPVKGKILMATYPLQAADYPKLPIYIFMLNEQGEPLYYKRSRSRMMDFKRVRTTDGLIRYLYHDADLDMGTPGAWVVMDERFNEVKRIRMEAIPGITETDPDLHDLVFLNDNHYVLIAYPHEKVLNFPGKISVPTNIISSVIQEVKDGKVVLNWDFKDHPELFNFITATADYPFQGELWSDNTHINSVAIDPADGHLIASFRNISSVLKINRQTGDIIWRLGGPGDQFGLTPEQNISMQHHAQMLSPGHLLLFDNGNASKRTRIVEMDLNETTRTVSHFKQFVPNPNRFSPFMGSVQLLPPSSYFIGWGGHPGDPAASDVSEVNTATGKTEFELWLSGFYTYRAYKYTD